MDQHYQQQDSLCGPNEDDWNLFVQNQTPSNSVEDKQLNTRLEFNSKEVKDALFGEAIVYGELINIIIDSGSKGSAISKQFLDRKQQLVDEPTVIKLIDIQGNRSSLLGLKKNVQINVEGWDLGIDMIVTESKDYNILLGNDWISKSRANINYDQGIMTLITPDGTITTPITCWDSIKNPH